MVERVRVFLKNILFLFHSNIAIIFQVTNPAGDMMSLDVYEV